MFILLSGCLRKVLMFYRFLHMTETGCIKKYDFPGAPFGETIPYMAETGCIRGK